MLSSLLINIAWRLGAVPPATETSAEHVAIKNAMARQDDNAIRQQIDEANLSPDALQALLAHAFLQNRSLAIKEALLGHPACDLPTRQTALELALQHDDLPLARQALQQGADPEKITARPQADSMRSLLTYARRKNKLYPSNASHTQETDLDRALRGGLDDSERKKAWNLLIQAAPGNREAWRDAVKENRVDVQRAILLLNADQDRGFRLLQKDAVTDKGVAEVMKEIPYFPPKRGLPQNFNGEAKFPEAKEEILCRHLAEHRQSVQERDPKNKFDDAQFQFASPPAIEAHVSCDTEAKYNHLLVHAKEARLFRNRDFGKALVQQLNAMDKGGEASRLILLTSSDHAMSVGLKIKEKDGKPAYVAELFDPNVTTSHVRIASDSLHTLETLTLENLIDGAAAYKDYYPELDGLSVMFVRPPPQEEQARTASVQGAVENRTLTSCIEDKDINATALFHMLKNGFAGDLRRLKEEIASRPEKERFELLAAKDTNGNPGLYRALQNGHADVIQAFGELLEELVPEDQRAELFLLAAKDAKNLPGLYFALQKGHADAIRAFGKLLSLVPPDQHAELLAAKDARSLPGLHMALQEGRADAIKAFGELLLLVPEDQRAELLAAKDINDVPGLCAALMIGNTDAIHELGELLHQVSPKERAQLLAVTVNGSSVLAEALKEGKLKALEQYIEIVKKTAPVLSPQDRAALLAYIRQSYEAQRWGMWVNAPHYEALKKKNPDFHLRFTEMLNALQP